MQQFAWLTHSIEPVLIIGCCCAFILGVSLAWRKAGPTSHLHQDECGGTYSLSLVLVTPIYALFICLIIETSLISVVKLGTLYASYSAARSAMVWLPAEVPHPEKIQLAAAQAMTPFASSLKEHIITNSSENAAADNNSEEYFEAYQLTPYATQSQKYVARKHAYAMQATEVTIELERDERIDPGTSKRKPKITATVNYEFPINVPGVGRIFGAKTTQPGGYFYSRIISSTSTLDLESPISKDFRLGIGYDSDYE